MKEKPKEDHQIVKENILARTKPQIEFLTTNRTKTRMNEEVMHQYLVEYAKFCQFSYRNRYFCPVKQDLHTFDLNDPHNRDTWRKS